jgi:ferritin-like metal-binding protein YciE
MSSHGIVLSRTRIVSSQSCSLPLRRSSITRHGTLKSWPIRLGKTGAAEMLDATLREQTKTNQALTRLAEASSMKGDSKKVA